ncbi:MAG TPA: response regulator, partial [Methylomirabilota bacterium]|nr:response regulator [Methylomirabilota bacterium]
PSPRSHAGLGLGLAIVRHLVELHGGRVRAESEGVGQGATFTVVLPIVASPEDTASAPMPAARRSDEERLEGLRVLVVEDDADARELVATVLAQAGAVTFTASNGRDGIAMVPRVRPDVLVCDLAMPDQDGLTVVREVKAWAAETGVALPALALTAYARAEDREQALAEGFDRYLTKPVEPSELVGIVAGLARR